MAANPDEYRMSFGEHLEELRSRIIRALLGVLAGGIIAWVFRLPILAWLLRPLDIAWFCRGKDVKPSVIFGYMIHPAQFDALVAAAPPSPEGPPALHFAGPADAFVAFVKIALMGGMVMALPVIFYQVWAFIAPGLYKREKRLVLPFVSLSTLFFVAGSVFGYYLVFPVGFEWFLDFAGKIPGTNAVIKPTLMMDEYLGFTSQMLLAFGVVFELPLFVFFLALAGIVTGKQLFSFGRYFTVIAFILAAILTPSTDVYSQVMLGAPLVLLYFLAAFLAMFFGPKEAQGFRKNLPSARVPAANTIQPDKKKKPAAAPTAKKK